MHSFYSLSTGLFTGSALNVEPFDQAKLDAATPAGCAAIEGQHDYLCRKVDLDTLTVVDHRPPRPADSTFLTFEWDDATRRWVGSLTPEAIAVDQREDRNARLAACDWTQVVDSPLSVEQRAAWAAYREALRQVPEQAGFPTAIEWPAVPAT